VNMGNGDGDVYNGAALTAHDRPDDNVVVFNTFIGNNTHYQMGGRTGGLGSSNTVVANNIFVGGGDMASVSSSGPYTGSWSNNIRWNTSSAGNMPASAYASVNPLLAKDANGVYHVQAGSPAINAGRAAFDFYGALVSFASVTNDMDGQVRDANKDTGADEFSATAISVKILTTNDVGPFSVGSDLSAARPRINRFSGSGLGLSLSGTNGVPGTTCYVLASTDLTLPLPNWARVATNQFDANGALAFDFVGSLGLARQFFALQVP